eukprot:4929218-Prorocentrum_lima.AAC.1
MTSSLVGSEMCIRDSPWTAFLRPNYLGSTTVEMLSYLFEMNEEDATVLPVSYTHLTLPTICSV